jgi:Flp pilus assembly protein TadG
MFIQLRQLLQRGRGQEGAAAVEFALILPVLVLLTLGALDMGHMFYIDHLITNASREGARYAAKYVDPSIGDPSSAAISAYVTGTASGQLNYSQFNLPNLTVTGTITNNIATVTVSANKEWFVLNGLLGLDTKVLTATTAMKMERPAT